MTDDPVASLILLLFKQTKKCSNKPEYIKGTWDGFVFSYTYKC